MLRLFAETYKAQGHRAVLPTGRSAEPSDTPPSEVDQEEVAATLANSTEVIPSGRSSTAAPAEFINRTFGDYILLNKLGAGGMGIVYRALHHRANRLVALKLIRPERLETLAQQERQRWLDRFRTESQAAARLEHDHVITVYDVGEIDGTLYYSMQYIEGRSLAEMVREGPLENDRAARLIEGVARGVEHAHNHGILHRDLKPPNILVRHCAEDVGRYERRIRIRLRAWVSVGERAFVTDFGIAKWMEAEAGGATHTGDVIGTPSYMAPEQARDSSRCTAASDVYGLGATLYEALTGRPPFRGVSPLDTLRQVIEQDPVAPRDLNRTINRDLETITLKALAKEPAGATALRLRWRTTCSAISRASRSTPGR